MAKVTREQTLKQRRALKQEKKDEKKLAAAMARDAEAAGDTEPEAVVDDEVPVD